MPLPFAGKTSRIQAPPFPRRGKAAFARFLSAEPLERAAGSRLIRFFGHWTKGRLTGVGSLRGESHLCLLFVEKESREKDIGGTLLKEMAYFARKRAQPL